VTTVTDGAQSPGLSELSRHFGGIGHFSLYIKVSQSVEHETLNLGVVGLCPTLGAKKDCPGLTPASN